MLVQIVRFNSTLSAADVQAMYEARADRYRTVPGLLQKYYLSFANGEHGAVYLWASAEALARFRESDLARSIPEAYQVRGTPEVQVAEVALVLRPGAAATNRDDAPAQE
jgi:hypothetical protein